MLRVFLSTVILMIILDSAESARKNTRKGRHNHHSQKCTEPPTLKDDLSDWIRESMDGASGDNISEEWMNMKTVEADICKQSPRTKGESTVMQRALCPWEIRIDFDDTREPKFLSEAYCLCKRSRGASGAFCMPITKEIPVLRRTSCDPSTGYWQYIRSTHTFVVGCHSVLPRTQRATIFSNSRLPSNAV